MSHRQSRADNRDRSESIGRPGVRKTAYRFPIPAALCLALLGGISPLRAGQTPPELRVAAAADLTKAFTEIAKSYRQETGQSVKLTFGATGQLTRQIENGA